MKKCYLAAPIFNKKQLAVVSNITMTLKLLEFQYFSPYEASNSIWKGRAPKDCTSEERSQVLLGNIEHLVWADLLIACVGLTEDGKTDTGVTWEMGYFNALNLQANELVRQGIHAPQNFTLAYIDPDDERQHMNLMLAGTVDAVAWGPAQLHNALKKLAMAAPGSQNDVRKQYDPSKHLLHEKEPIT